MVLAGTVAGGIGHHTDERCPVDCLGAFLDVSPATSTRPTRRQASPGDEARRSDLPGQNLAHVGFTVMTVCPILILSPFFSHWGV
jgi:hypothetical protein